MLIFTMFYCLKKIKTNIWRYHYFTPVYQKSWWYDLQFLRYRAWQTEIGNFGSFLPFYLPKKPTIQNFEMKELARDIILHMCTKNHNHMRYSFWDTESEGQIFFVILGHCFFLLPAPPPPPNNPENQNFEKMKKHLEMSSFCTCVPKITITWCMFFEIWSATDCKMTMFCHFGSFLTFYSTSNLKN